MTIDSTHQLEAIRGLPDHLEDALARVDAAGLEQSDSAGLAICGMGGSGVGALLAIGALGLRTTRPIVAVRDYALPSWVTDDWTILFSSYSGGTEETLACFDTAPPARRIATCTGGELAERAEAAGVPIISLPRNFQPRAAVGYAVVVALEVAALAGVAPSVRDEVQAAAALLRAEDIDTEARALAEAVGSSVPVVCGAGLTTPVAYRWKCQVNENANRAAFWSQLPEANHNEIEGWGDRSVLAPVFLEDSQSPERIRRRFELTAEVIGGAHHLLSRGETPTERLMSLVHLGDLFSYHLAVGDGTDPVAIPTLERLKSKL